MRGRLILFALLGLGALLSPLPVGAQTSARQLDDSGPPPGYAILSLPEDGHYSGDRISFILLPPDSEAARDQEVWLTLPGATAPETAAFGRYGIGGTRRATFRWAWDTSALPPAKYPVIFQISPDGPAWRQWVTLRPASALAEPVRASAWQSIAIDCCVVYFASGTASQRDLEDLLDTIQTQAELAATRMQTAYSELVQVVLLPRVLGHGGFATDKIYVSYLDRNYAGEAFAQVMHHELIHVLDARLGAGLRPTMLIEGLAVYHSGGHFKPEPLLPRAAALLELGWYVPLDQLADDFYFKQHEVGYLQAAALVEYMVARWGYPAFDNFYRSIQPVNNGGQAAALDAALQLHFGLSLAELDGEFIAHLQANPATSEQATDVRQTVEFYDTVRRYQQALDPNAYFLSAWLLDIDSMLAESITADYVRHPRSATHLTLELILINAEEALRVGDAVAAQAGIDAVNAVLEEIESGATNPWQASPLAAEVLQVVQTVHRWGYEPQQVTLLDGQARVQASQPTAALPGLQSLELTYDGQEWRLLGSGW